MDAVMIQSLLDANANKHLFLSQRHADYRPDGSEDEQPCVAGLGNCRHRHHHAGTNGRNNQPRCREDIQGVSGIRKGRGTSSLDILTLPKKAIMKKRITTDPVLRHSLHMTRDPSDINHSAPMTTLMKYQRS